MSNRDPTSSSGVTEIPLQTSVLQAHRSGWREDARMASGAFTPEDFRGAEGDQGLPYKSRTDCKEAFWWRTNRRLVPTHGAGFVCMGHRRSARRSDTTNNN